MALFRCPNRIKLREKVIFCVAATFGPSEEGVSKKKEEDDVRRAKLDLSTCQAERAGLVQRLLQQ